MAANLADHVPIKAVSTVSGNTPKTMAVNEKAGQTFLAGVPVMNNAGVLQEWDGATVAAGILGVSLEDAKNLATDGAGAPGAFGSVGFPGASPTWGRVQGQPAAVNFGAGDPMTDGRTDLEIANEDTIFLAQVDNSAFAVAADATVVQADLFKYYGMTKDATGHWYVDRAKATKGTNTVCQIVGFWPSDGLILNGRVQIKFQSAAQQGTGA
jgi:hypothetical protein